MLGRGPSNKNLCIFVCLLDSLKDLDTISKYNMKEVPWDQVQCGGLTLTPHSLLVSVSQCDIHV